METQDEQSLEENSEESLEETEAASAVMTVGPTTIYDAGNGAIYWTSKMDVDSDGAPNSYCPESLSHVAIDYLANAGHPGKWWGITTNRGTPYIQAPPSSVSQKPTLITFRENPTPSLVATSPGSKFEFFLPEENLFSFSVPPYTRAASRM